MKTENEVISRLKRWANEQDQVRAVLLTSSRANPKATIDVLSDYDVWLLVNGPDLLIGEDSWLRDFGEILVSFKDKFREEGITIYTRLVLYGDGVRIDFSLSTVEDFEKIRQKPVLPAFLDIGYRVLIDKDGLTVGLKKPTYSAYTVTKPSEEEYAAVVNAFWWDITYVAKSLWRDELFFAKYMLDSILRFSKLEKVIEWYIGCEHNWSVNPNKHGRWFKKYLDDQTWLDLEATFADAKEESNWQAVFNMADLFSRLAVRVGGELGYNYPNKLEENVRAWMLKVKGLKRGALDDSCRS